MGKKRNDLASKDISGLWRVHTPNLLNEVLLNRGAEALSIPLNILGRLLGQVGERAAELNDPQLNALMMRLTIYSVADPASPDYAPDVVADVLGRAERTAA